MLSLGVVFAFVPAAQAGTGTACSGNQCSGKDPTQTFEPISGAECSSGAVDTADYPFGKSVFGGTLELRWGPNCMTNWTRFRPANNGKYDIWVANCTTGEFAGNGPFNFYTFSGGGTHYSDQVYAGNEPAQACVYSYTDNIDDCITQQGCG
jgi:hypothetical protein